MNTIYITSISQILLQTFINKKQHIPVIFCKNKLMCFSGTAQQPQEDILQLAIHQSGIGHQSSQLSATQDGVTENLESQTISQDTESDISANSNDLPPFLTQIAAGNNNDICYYSSTSNHLMQ